MISTYVTVIHGSKIGFLYSFSKYFKIFGSIFRYYFYFCPKLLRTYLVVVCPILEWPRSEIVRINQSTTKNSLHTPMLLHVVQLLIQLLTDFDSDWTNSFQFIYFNTFYFTILLCCLSCFSIFTSFITAKILYKKLNFDGSHAMMLLSKQMYWNNYISNKIIWI